MPLIKSHMEQEVETLLFIKEVSREILSLPVTSDSHFADGSIDAERPDELGLE